MFYKHKTPATTKKKLERITFSVNPFTATNSVHFPLSFSLCILFARQIIISTEHLFFNITLWMHTIKRRKTARSGQWNVTWQKQWTRTWADEQMNTQTTNKSVWREMSCWFMHDAFCRCYWCVLCLQILRCNTNTFRKLREKKTENCTKGNNSFHIHIHTIRNLCERSELNFICMYFVYGNK